MFKIIRWGTLVAIIMMLAGCANAIHFYETEKITLLTLEGGTDPSRQITGTLGFGQRVVLVTPPKLGDNKGDSVSSLVSFRMSKNFSEVTINSALITGTAASALGEKDVKKTTQHWSKEVANEVSTQKAMASDVAAQLAPGGMVDQGKLQTLLEKSPANSISATETGYLRGLKTAADLKDHLSDAPPAIVKKLYSAIHQP